MKRNVLLCLLLIATIFISCSTGKKSNDFSNEVIEIIIDPNAQQIGNLKLNDIVKTITYVPLETTDECLIGDIVYCLLSEKYFIVSCRQSRRCFLFDRTGRFVTSVGSVGQGPGEYSLMAEPIQIDELNGQIILKASKRLLYYDLKGRYIKTVPIEDISGILSDHTDFYLVKNRNEGVTPFTYTILDKDFMQIAQSIQPLSFTMNPPGSQVGIGVSFCQYVFNNQVHVRETMLNDTLYKISPDFTFIPKYIVNTGTYGMTLETRSDTKLFMQEIRSTRLLIINSMFETKDFVLLSYRKLPETNRPLYFNKANNKLYYFSSASGIPNDYDGGFDFWPQYQYKNQLIAFYQANIFGEHLNGSEKLNPQASPDVISRFTHLSRNIDAEDNPVMMVVTLK